MKSKTKFRVSVGPLKHGNDLVTDHIEWTVRLCFHNCRHYQNSAMSRYLRRKLETVPNMIFDTETAKNKIKSLKASSSAGPDWLSSNCLVDHVEELAYPLSVIHTKSMESGVVPGDWKRLMSHPNLRTRGPKVRQKTANWYPWPAFHAR